MIWLYIIAIAVLIGAALNASFDQLWPESEPQQARIELVRRLRRARLRRARSHASGDDPDGDAAREADPDADRDANREADQDAGPSAVEEEEQEADLAEEETLVLRREPRI